MRWKFTAAVLSLIVLATCVWFPALHFGFVYDDHLQIESNPQLQSWSALGQALHEPLWTQLGPEKASPYFRPLFLLVLFVEHMLFGSNPAPWHLVSMSLHCLVTLALFLFLFLHFGRLLPGWIAAAIFVCSPLTTEVACWLSACSESIYVLLVLCALCGLVLSDRAKTPTGALALQFSSTSTLALAVFAKETAVVAVVLALAYEIRFLTRKPLLRRVTVYAPLLIPVVAHLCIRPVALHAESRLMIQVLSTIPYTCLFALRKLVWPVPVSEFYDFWLQQTRSFFSLAWHIGILFGIAGEILWWSLRSRTLRSRNLENRSLRSRFTAWALAVVALPLIAALAGGFYFRDYDLFHDRYLYLSFAGVACLIAALIDSVETRPQLRVLVSAAAVLVLCFEATQSVSASQQFRDDLSLYSRATQVAPHNIVAWQLLAETAVGRADCPTALEAYQRAQQLRPDIWKTSFFLGIGYLRCGRYASAEEAFRQAANLPGATSDQAALGWYELGRVELVQDNLAAALTSLRKAASLDPSSKKIKVLLAQLLSAQGASS